jgi:DNA primase
MHIPEHIVEQVRVHNDIVDVIGEHIKLTKAGKNFKGLCPFHHEKTPSFSVNQELGLYKCFGCGKSGNSITFLMEYAGETFVDAVRLLATRAGIALEIDDANSEEDKLELSRKDKAYRLMAESSKLYSTELQTESGRVAKNYFLRRGFSNEVLIEFEVGYAPDDWQKTMNTMIKQGFSLETLADAGMIVQKEDGKTYDRFRGRAMFPVHDPMGRVIAFGARILTNEKDQPKYINSPQSLIYDKSSVLYGLYQAKQTIRQVDSALLCEGYADVMTLHQFGFTNAVASSGTSLTKEQLQLLARYTKNVVIIYDGDTAGINATIRGVEIALESGFEVKIVTLPNNDDPDSFLRGNSSEALQTYIRNAPTFIEFMAEHYKKTGLLSTAKGQADALRGLVGLVRKVQDNLQHDFIIRQIAQRFGITESLLYDELRKSGYTPKNSPTQQIEQVPAKEYPQPQYRRDFPNKKFGKSYTSKQHLPPPEPPPQFKQSSIKPEERELLSLAITSPSVFTMLEDTYSVTTDTFISEDAKAIYNVVQHAHHHGTEVAGHIMMNQQLSPSAKDIITDILFGNDKPSASWERFNIEITTPKPESILRDVLLKLRLSKVRSEISDIQQKMRSDNGNTSIEDLQRVIELNKLRSSLEAQLHNIETSGDEFE